LLLLLLLLLLLRERAPTYLSHMVFISKSYLLKRVIVPWYQQLPWAFPPRDYALHRSTTEGVLLSEGSRLYLKQEKFIFFPTNTRSVVETRAWLLLSFFLSFF